MKKATDARTDFDAKYVNTSKHKAVPRKEVPMGVAKPIFKVWTMDGSRVNDP